MVDGRWLLNLLLPFAKLADQPDDEDDGTDDSGDFRELNENNPDDDSAHVAHITVSAFAGLVTKALFAAGPAALSISGTFRVDRGAVDTG